MTDDPHISGAPQQLTWALQDTSISVDGHAEFTFRASAANEVGRFGVDLSATADNGFAVTGVEDGARVTVTRATLRPPSLIEPTPDATIRECAILLRWAAALGARSYDLLIDGSAVAERMTGTEAGRTLGAGDHTWQVVARGAVGATAASAVGRCTVIASSGAGGVVAAAAPTPRPNDDHATLAKRYMPIIEVEKADGWWPISFPTVFKLRNARGNKQTCRYQPHDFASNDQLGCGVRSRDLVPNEGDDQYLNYPANQSDPLMQMVIFQRALGERAPYDSSTVYWFRGGNPGTNRQLFTIQYWVFYGYNPLRFGEHEGDWEHVAIQFGRQQRPLGAFVAAHGGLSQPTSWNDEELRVVGDGENCSHDSTRQQSQRSRVCVFAARHSHASYKRCGIHYRLGPPDTVECDDKLRYHFNRSPVLARMARRPWACWKGRAGQQTSKLKRQIKVNAPKMPLQQQHDYATNANPCGEAARARAGLLTRAAAPANAERPAVPAALADRIEDRGASFDQRMDTCDEWNAPPSQGLRIVVCDQALLTSWLAGGGDPDFERLRIVGGNGDDTSPSAVATRGTTSDQLGRSGIESTGAARPRIAVAVRRANGALYEARFAAVDLLPGERVSLARARGGVLELRDGAGHVLASTRLRISARGGPVPPKRLRARRQGRRVFVSWQTPVTPAGQRYVVKLGRRGSTLRTAVIVRRQAGRRVYRVTVPDSRSTRVELWTQLADATIPLATMIRR